MPAPPALTIRPEIVDQAGIETAVARRPRMMKLTQAIDL
jgi:hypothetical protein